MASNKWLYFSSIVLFQYRLPHTFSDPLKVNMCRYIVKKDLRLYQMSFIWVTHFYIFFLNSTFNGNCKKHWYLFIYFREKRNIYNQFRCQNSIPDWSIKKRAWQRNSHVYIWAERLQCCERCLFKRSEWIQRGRFIDYNNMACWNTAGWNYKGMLTIFSCQKI